MNAVAARRSAHYSYLSYLSVSVAMDSFVGKYERVSAEKYDDFLKTLDVNFLLRKAATVSSPVMEVAKEGDLWSIKTSTSLKSMELKFELGKEFEETTADGREVTAVVTLEGNKLITVQKAKKAGEKSTKSVREFNGDEVIQTMTIDGVDDLVCVQKFKRIS